MYVAKQARNEETRRRNMRVRNCQRSRFGFVARQLCGHHRNIYRADRDLTALSNPRAIPTRQIYKPRYARRAFGPPRFASLSVK